MRELLLLALIFVSIFISSSLFINAAASHHLHKPKYTQLFVYTVPVQKDGCFVFKHQSNAEIAAANKSATEFNLGIVAAGKAVSGKKCLGDKDFCDGWNFAATGYTSTKDPLPSSISRN